jgi:hypothetical protein
MPGAFVNCGFETEEVPSHPPFNSWIQTVLWWVFHGMSVHQKSVSPTRSEGSFVYKGEVNTMAYVGYPQILGVTPLRESGTRRTQEDWAKFDAEGAKQAPKRKQSGEPKTATPEDEEQDRRMSRMTPASVRRTGGISKKGLDARRKARGRGIQIGDYGRGVKML